MSTERTRFAAPTSLTERAVAPDLARGAMLLLIALANATWYLWGAETRALSIHPVDGSVIDRVWQTVLIVAVDGRTYPMFAFLFGYGIWQLYRRQVDAGTSERDARRLLRRRHWWMLAFGLVHAALLWMGDIVGAYGLVGLIVTWLFLGRRDRTLVIWAASISFVMLGGGAMSALGAGIAASLPGGAETAASEMPFDVRAPIQEQSYPLSILLRTGVWLLLTPGQALFTGAVPVAVLLALLAARHRVLDDPGAHLPVLRRWAIGGIAAGWLVGGAVALQNLDLLGIPAALDFGFLGVNPLAGLACGVGYVALFGLIASRGPGGVASRALQAVGKRSLTFYLAQSVVFAPVMSAWGLGLGEHLGSASMALWAVGVWLVTVAIAVLMERAGRRGPAEWLLRRLAYRN